MRGPLIPSTGTRDIAVLSEISRRIRKYAIEMTTAAGSGHATSALSIAEIMAVLYFSELRVDPLRPDDPDRDRFILSKGHGCPALYAALAMRGFFPEEELETFRRLGSRLQGHPDVLKCPGVEMSTGSLGQGLSVGMGMALAARLDGRAYRVYVLLGDGECQEGQVWEAAMSAAHYALDNLVAIVDRNRIQQSARTEELCALEPLGAKWEAFGWTALEADGHNIPALLDVFAEARRVKGKPVVIIARTKKGKGISFLEDRLGWHGKPLNPEQRELALKELGRDGGASFV
ncbi:MAG: transketolase [Armatimonadota bacterium]|nr:transketolase [Armatimonadota bacterium]MDR7433495.1 transketolase [Armatimonadota bacterium]